MNKRVLSRAAAFVTAGVMVVILGVLPALAAAPPNDDIATATAITGLPFSEGIDTTEATQSAGDPWLYCYPYTGQATVWYTYTASTSQSLAVSTAGSTYSHVLAVFYGSPGAQHPIACSGGGGSPLVFRAMAGTTYYFLVAGTQSPYPGGGGAGGWLNFSLDVAPPPTASMWITNPPFSGLRIFEFHNQSSDNGCWGCNMTAAWDFGDGGTSSEWSPVHQYARDATYTVTLTVTTYDGRMATTRSELVVETPPPVAVFEPYPSDPSIYDNPYFYNWSHDPACYWGCGDMTAEWDFGDGATSSEWSPYHQYTADGEYTVSLTVTATEGRTATTTRQVQVRTIDVSILRFTVPQSARVGQTRTISVEVTNNTYPVEVRVELYKSTAGDWQWVGSSVQLVPVRGLNRTTRFELNYTFTAEDAQLGRINFKAVAVTLSGRDAISTNNEAVSLPTRVTR